MASLPIRRIVARVFCQATEEEDRVKHALGIALPAGAEGRDRVEGQFGNPVVILTRTAERAEEINAAWARWREAGLLPALLGTLERRLDEDGILHFRLEKEAAYGEQLVLADCSDSIDIQVKLKAYPAKPAEIHRVARALLGGSA